MYDDEQDKRLKKPNILVRVLGGYCGQRFGKRCGNILR